MTELSPSSFFVPPETIIVNRDNRQRRKIDVENDGLLQSIEKRGVLHPIIVRTTGDRQYELVIGERRLECCRRLNRQVPIRFFEDLSPIEASIVEIEENIRRTDLPWRDYAAAVTKIHRIYQRESPSWTISATADSLGFSSTWMTRVLHVGRALEDQNPRISQAGSIDEAYNILARISERKTAQIVQELIEAGGNSDPQSDNINDVSDKCDLPLLIRNGGTDTSIPISNETPGRTVGNEARSPIREINPIIVADFLTWAREYSGPKFNVIHIDFPYGRGVGRTGPIDTYEDTPELFWQLTDCFCTNIDRFVSYSAHVIFWFSMKKYHQLRHKLLDIDLLIPEHPLIWVHPGTNSFSPLQGMQPAIGYDVALFCTRGRRPLVKTGMNYYVAPAVSKPIHPTQKSEPMLRYFLSMVVDDTTDFLDPTAGSGSSLRAAEDLGARSVLGLELNSEYATIANSACHDARQLRLLNKRITENGTEESE